MKTPKIFTHICFAAAGLFFLCYACHQKQAPNKHSNWADSSFTDNSTVSNETDKLEKFCFTQEKSTQSKDSSFVYLSILGNKVSGEFSWIPFEKDSRRGSLNGIKKGDTIDVVWTFTQEGMEDTLRTVFLLEKDKLKQKPYVVNQQNGRQFTDDQSDFSLSYQKVNCK